MRISLILIVILVLTLFTGCVQTPPANVKDFGKLSTAPASCNTNYSSFTYYDTDINNLCFCNSTDWRQIDDGTTCG